MEEQKEVLNDRQQYIEIVGNKKAQEIHIPEAAVDTAWGSCFHLNFLLEQLLPAPIGEVD